MTVEVLLQELDQLGVELWPQGERLCYRIPRSVLEPDLLDRLRESKAEILAELQRRRPPLDELPPLVPEPERRGEPFAPTAIQQAYLLGRTELFELGNVGPTSYVELEWRELDLERLEAAWRFLIERHDVLRVVAQGDGRLRILDRVPPAPIITVEDLRGREPDAVERRLEELRREGAERLFRPEDWPLFDVRASVLDGGRTRLHVSRDLLISDVRSSGILFEELLLLYLEPATELPALEISVRDYAVALERLRRHDAYRRCLAYWEERLPGLPPAPELPASRPPAGPAGRHRFVRHHATFDAELFDRLSRAAARRGLTPSVVLCATFSEVLARWSNSLRFVINVLYSHRLPLHPQVERLVGNFASTLLLEVDVRGGGGFGAPFEQRARRLQERLWDDMGHGLVSGVDVLRELNRRHGRGQQRAAMPVVFSSALPFARDAAGELTENARLEGGPFTTVYHSVQTPQVMLEVLAALDRGALHLTWNVVEGLFPPGFVEAAFDAHRRWVRRLAEEDAAWSEPDPDLVPRDQLDRRARVNDTQALAPGLPLHRLTASAPAPSEVAVVAGAARLTYGELDRRADRLAAVLVRAGAGPERIVAVGMRKGWEQVVAALGILRAGAAYLPVDPALPRERRFHLLERADVELVVGQPDLLADLAWPEWVRRIAVAEDEPREAVAVGPRVPAAAGLDSLAYVIFTSGSTGLPKGVMIDHRGAANTVADINRRLDLSPRDRVLALSSLSFDLSVWDVFGTLAAGGRIVLPDPDAARDPAHWHRLVVEEGVTVWNSVPALMEIYVELLEGRGEPLPPSLRIVMLSGDWIPVTLPDRIRALGRDVRVISLGGATEASIWSIAHEVDGVDPEWSSIPYGTPLDNQVFHVLDKRLRPCPEGVAGALFIGGSGLARGYWKDPRKTATSFVPDPVTGRRLYRTGDLGRYLPDAAIEFLGREDLQVKIQGYRIELGEIETALARHPAVREAVVVAVGEAKGHKRLVAFFVPCEEASAERERLASTELGAFLAGKLPEYMVPGVFVPLDEVPLTANGKVDRERLGQRRYLSPGRGGGSSAAPARGTTEARLVAIWKEVLEQDRLGVDENFFDIGGDSMLALRLLARIEQETAVRLPLAAVYEAETIEELAARLDGGEAA